MPWIFLCGGSWNGLKDYLNSWEPDSAMFLLRSSGGVRATFPSRPSHYPLTPSLTANTYGRLSFSIREELVDGGDGDERMPLEIAR
jgi:hypothetical protein